MKKITFGLCLFLLSMLTPLVSCNKKDVENTNSLLVEQLKTVTDSIVKNTQVPGIVVLVVDHKRGIDWMYTPGFSDVPGKFPMDGSFTFRIASNTKAFTGTVLLQLVDEGRLSLSDKLSEYYPDFPKADSITIAMLCNMTSGISDYFYDPQFISSYTSNPFKIFPPEELVNIAASNPFTSTPGTDWNYSNTNTVILGMIIEQITGHTLEAEINNRILIPMQLIHTGFQSTGADFPGPHARGYYFPDIENYGDMTAPYDISRAWACGSMYSTTEDLQKFVERLVGGGFLSDTLQNRRLSDMRYIGGLYGSYGLHLLKHGSFYGHGGTLWGFTSVMFHSVKHNSTIIIYFNCNLEATIHPLNLFLRYVNILYGNDY